MTDLGTAATADRFEVRATADTHFGWIRTRLSLERTMMSWLRTATALIGFGFAIVQYLNHLQQAPEASPAYLPTAPEYLGLALISYGVLALLISIWAVLLDASLPLARIVRANRRNDKGGNAVAGHRGCHSPHLHRRLRVLCRAPSPHLAAKPNDRNPQHLLHH
jgi:uncharacterized membrane protein YidH (DUF202 family)